MKQLLFFLGLIISSSLMGQDQWKNIYIETAWKERDSWQRADEIIKKLNIKPGNRVADIGCHEGYMTFKLSKIVGAQGKVYAVDIEQPRLDKLKIHLNDQQIKNVTIVKGDYDNPKLPINSLHAVLILDTYHEMDDHDKILAHVKTALRTGGRLVICEAIASSRKNLDRSEQERKHELGMDYALSDLKKAGFQISFKQDPFIDREKTKGDKMWIVVATK